MSLQERYHHLRGVRWIIHRPTRGRSSHEHAEAAGHRPDDVCVTFHTARNMTNAIIIEHHTADDIVLLGCGCHNTQLAVQMLVLQPAVKASFTVFSKTAAHLRKSAQSQEASEQAHKVHLLHFARCRCWHVRCCNTYCLESAFCSLLTPSGRAIC